MKTKKDFFFCSKKPPLNIDELKGIDLCLSYLPWKEHFVIEIGKKYAHQTGYNEVYSKLNFGNLGRSHTFCFMILLCSLDIFNFHKTSLIKHFRLCGSAKHWKKIVFN